MDQTVSAQFLNMFSTLIGFVETLPNQGLIKILGALGMVILPVLLVFVAVRFIIRISGSIQRMAALGAMKKDDTPGNKILIASVRGHAGGTARNKVMEALENRLPEFNFGSAFYMGAAPIEIGAMDFALSRADFETLESSFQASNADLIIWGDANYAQNVTRLCFTTPKLLHGGSAKGFFTLDLKSQPGAWANSEYLAIAYVAGRRLRPSLGKPSDFRAERFQSILSSMSQLIDVKDVLSGQALTEIEDDFAAGALHVGEALNSTEWLNKSIDFRVRALSEMKPGDDPIRWSQAKIDLGRAMCRICATKFDPGMLQEAMTHIREGIDNTKSDERMRLAETGFTALQKAEQMLADRRRFSIRWSV